ncbi:unnamed protein product [Ectocarpus sp. 12 AP-2014]
MIVCIAIIGRQNEPLFLRTYTDAEGEEEEDANLRLHNIVHSSLDVVGERKVGRKGASGAADVSTDMFLGHLCPIDEYRVYGYMTSTRLKLLAVLEDVNDIREPELKRVFSTVHNVYVNYLRNPFSPLAKPVDSAKFRLSVDRQINDYNS